MPNKSRYFPSGYIFHVMNRAVVCSEIFLTEQDYGAFVSVLAEMQLRVPIHILAWCIMPNHWHLVLSPERDQDMLEYMRLVTVPHIQRWHAYHKDELDRRVISGSVQCLRDREKRVFANGFALC